MSIDPIWWVSGLCSTFAAAIQAKYGGELWAIVNHSRKYPDDEQLWHCYCVIDSIAYDANGPTTIEEASDVSETKWPIPEMDKPHDVVMLWKKVDEEWLLRVHCENYNRNDFPEVYDYIERNRGLFKSLTNTR